MYHDWPEMTALIGSRICHDLIGPLGAVGNGLELLVMSGIEPSPELSLIGESIETANAKIRFFRVAYGNAPAGSTIAQPEIRSVLDGYFAHSRLELVWHPSREVARREAKLLFLALQCIENALPHGGHIDVHHTGDGWELLADGEKRRAEPHLWELLDGQRIEQHVSASQVQFALLAALTRRRNPALRVDIAKTRLRIRL
ncbi:MAG: histidine phosphotransferase family protein [Paracoccaceae bacterium]